MASLCSVVCVSYNHAKFAKSGLQSIYAQRYRNIEIIVLDDGSSDNSSEVIRRELESSPFKTQFIEQENTGNVPANFNKAIEAASGEFVTMMSLDDVLMQHCISNAIDIISERENIIFVANSGHYKIDESGQRMGPDIHFPIDAPHIKTARELLEKEYETLGAFYVQGQVFRRDALLAVGCFEETMTGDDIILRTKLFMHLVSNPELKFFLGTDVVLAYRMHENNLHKKSLRQLKTVIEWKERYFPERPYPSLFYAWLNHFFKQCVRNGFDDALDAALDYHPVIRNHFSCYKRTWSYRKSMLRKKFHI